MLLSQFELKSPEGLDSSDFLHRGHVVVVGEDEGTLEVLDMLVDAFEMIGDLSYTVGTCLPRTAVCSGPLTFIKTVESYYSSVCGELIYLERLWFMGANGVRIPFKVRYRTPTRVLNNLVILKGITEIHNQYYSPEAWELSPYVSHLEALIKHIANHAYPSNIKLCENLDNISEYLRIITVGVVRLIDFAEDILDPAETIHSAGLLIKAITGHGGEGIPKLNLTETLIRDSEFATAIASELFTGLPPVADRITCNYLNSNDQGIAPSILADIPTAATRAETVQYDSTLTSVVGYAGTWADTPIINDPEWYGLIHKLNNSPETDFEMVLDIQCVGDMAFTSIKVIDNLLNRFLPHSDPESTALTALLAIIRDHFDTSPLIWEIGTHHPELEVIIHRNFMEQLRIDIIDKPTQDVIRQDYIDMAYASLFGFGVAHLPTPHE